MTCQVIYPKVAFHVLVLLHIFLPLLIDCLHLSVHIVYFILGLPAYHAGLNNKMRTSVLDDWISSKIKVVVATVAFGYVFSFLCLYLMQLFLLSVKYMIMRAVGG